MYDFMVIRLQCCWVTDYQARVRLVDMRIGTIVQGLVLANYIECHLTRHVCQGKVSVSMERLVRLVRPGWPWSGKSQKTRDECGLLCQSMIVKIITLLRSL